MTLLALGTTAPDSPDVELAWERLKIAAARATGSRRAEGATLVLALAGRRERLRIDFTAGEVMTTTTPRRADEVELCLAPDVFERFWLGGVHEPTGFLTGDLRVSGAAQSALGVLACLDLISVGLAQLTPGVNAPSRFTILRAAKLPLAMLQGRWTAARHRRRSASSGSNSRIRSGEPASHLSWDRGHPCRLRLPRRPGFAGTAYSTCGDPDRVRSYSLRRREVRSARQAGARPRRGDRRRVYRGRGTPRARTIRVCAVRERLARHCQYRGACRPPLRHCGQGTRWRSHTGDGADRSAARRRVTRCELRVWLCALVILAGGCGGDDADGGLYYKLPFARCLMEEHGLGRPPTAGTRQLVPRAVERAARESGEGSLAAFQQQDGAPLAAFLFFDDEPTAMRYQDRAFEREKNVLVFYEREPSASRRTLVSECLERSTPQQDLEAQTSG